MTEQPARVVCVVATYRRPRTVELLLRSLVRPDNDVQRVFLVDNADDAETAQVVANAVVPVERLVPPSNLSCGGGVKRGLQEALHDPHATHFWLLDDDAMAFPGALEVLLKGLREAQAEAAVPAVLDAKGKISWCPGLLEEEPNRVLQRSKVTLEEYQKLFGSRPVPFSWAPWPSLLVTRRAIEGAGFPRDDFWLMGEDIEYTLRLTHQFKGVFVPDAACGHYPPTPADNFEQGEIRHRIKFCSMLQNTSYAALHLRHCRRIIRHLPGNYLRFLRTFGVSASTVSDAMQAFWRGAVRGKPGAAPGYDHFYQRWLRMG